RPRQDPKQRALPRPVPPDHPKALPAPHLEAHVLQRHLLPVPPHPPQRRPLRQAVVRALVQLEHLPQPPRRDHHVVRRHSTSLISSRRRESTNKPSPTAPAAHPPIAAHSSHPGTVPWKNS